MRFNQYTSVPNRPKRFRVKIDGKETTLTQVGHGERYHTTGHVSEHTFPRGFVLREQTSFRTNGHLYEIGKSL